MIPTLVCGKLTGEAYLKCIVPTPKDSDLAVQTGGQGLCILNMHSGDFFSGNQYPENSVPGALKIVVGLGGFMQDIQDAALIHSILLAETANRFRLTRQLKSMHSACSVGKDFKVTLSLLGRTMVTNQSCPP